MDTLKNSGSSVVPTLPVTYNEVHLPDRDYSQTPPGPFSSPLPTLPDVIQMSEAQALSEPMNGRKRIKRACLLCRKRKTKCNGESPCQTCAKSSKQCEYDFSTLTKDETNGIFDQQPRSEQDARSGMDGYSEPVLPSRMRRKRQRSTETDEIGAPLCTKPWYTPRPVSEPRTYGTGGSSSAASPVVTPGFEQLSSSEKSSGTMQLEELSASTKGGPQTVGNHLRKHCAIVDQIFHQFEKSHGLLEAPSICKTESPGHPPSLLNLLDLWSSIQNGVDTELDAASLGHLTDIYLAKFSHAQPFLNVFPIREMVSQFIDRLALGNASGPWLPQCLCCGQSFWRQILHNAIILLVQALGSIAECSDYPSDGRISNVPDGAGSDGEDQSAAPHILGFAYYVCAGEALRLNDCVEENALSFDDQLYEVWALLLAGLYTGQLARVTESYHWIRRACRSWVELEARSSDERSADHQNYLNIAFLTCLQLESDVRVKLNVRESELGFYETRVWSSSLPFGNLASIDVNQTNSRNTYRDLQHQITLRLRLAQCSDFESCLSGGSEERIGIRHSLEKIESLCDTVSGIGGRRLPPSWRNNYSNQSRSDVKIAHLQQIYHGTRHSVLRPYLLFAMGKIKPRPVKPRPLDMENLPDIGELTTMGAQVEAIDIEGQEKRQRTKEEAILTAAKSSIDAAISSILAMDILGPGRFLITNIHGSTLTQFENVLLLSASFLSWLGPLMINKSDLIGLLKRTIKLLDKLSPLSTCLKGCADLMRITTFLVLHDEKYRSRSLEE